MASLAKSPGSAPAAAAARAGAARAILSGMLAGGLVLPVLALAGSPVYEAPLMCAGALVVTVIVALLAWRFAARGAAGMTIAAVLVVVACFLANWVSYPGSGFVVAGLLGAGIGPFLPRQRVDVPLALAGCAVAVAVLSIVRALDSVSAAALVLALLTAAALALVLGAGARADRRISASILTGVAVCYALFSIFWIGSTDPHVTWFGALTWHGPRHSNEVALTFDDGPNGRYTLETANILQAHGVEGAFFFVGKAVVQEPEVVRQLVASGNLVGNHSYYHGAFSYLDPRYPELTQTNHAIYAAAGVCPAYFRPPHGTHTPFMSHVATDAGMTLVTWDASARDWVDTDAARVARRIVDQSKGGSIIDLHDGSDGNIGVDRSVVVRALPLIIEGLHAKGLKVVRLDKLLGKPAYTSKC
ncbi:polysaccharide deacetylase family protein [bacterium]|nr:polysaccharide deacetylase family protein [bacterium]